jgi:hypothetical protein
LGNACSRLQRLLRVDADPGRRRAHEHQEVTAVCLRAVCDTSGLRCFVEEVIAEERSGAAHRIAADVLRDSRVDATELRVARRRLSLESGDERLCSGLSGAIVTGDLRIGLAVREEAVDRLEVRPEHRCDHGVGFPDDGRNRRAAGRRIRPMEVDLGNPSGLIGRRLDGEHRSESVAARGERDQGVNAQVPVGRENLDERVARGQSGDREVAACVRGHRRGVRRRRRALEEGRRNEHRGVCDRRAASAGIGRIGPVAVLEGPRDRRGAGSRGRGRHRDCARAAPATTTAASGED